MSVPDGTDPGTNCLVTANRLDRMLDDLSKTRIDPAVLEFTRLVSETVHELMWDLGRPGTVSDLTLMTRIEDATQMLGDVLNSLPITEEE